MKSYKTQRTQIEVIKCFDVIYEKSCDKNGAIHSNGNWRNKYRFLSGRIWIIKRDNRQYFQWNPICDGTDDIVIDKGMVSSNDDYCVIDDKLIIDTVSSKYIFKIIRYLNNFIVPPIIW